MKNWKKIEIGKFIDFNPTETLRVGTKAKKISMDKLVANERQIINYNISEFNGGAKFRNKDVLLAKITPCLENGKTAQVDFLKNDEVAFGSTEFIVLRENENSISDFIYYLAKSPTFRRKAISCMEGTSGRKRVSEKALKLQVLLLPDKTTQFQIANVLSSLDAKIELNNKINAQLEALAKTIYDYWFVQFDFPNEKGNPYKSSGGKMVYSEDLKREIPKGWEVGIIGDYAEVKKGDLITAKEANEGDIKVVAAGVNFSYKHSIHNREKFTITVSGSGANAGFVNFWREPIFASDCITVRGDTDAETMLLLHYLKYIQVHILSKASGSAQPHVYPSDIKNLNYAIPSKKLIIDFGKIVVPLNEQIGKNTKQNQQLTQLRDWLLPMLMNGQVTVGNVVKASTVKTKVVAFNNHLMLAIIPKQIHNKLRIGYGEVGLQKTVFNMLAVANYNMNYDFANSNNGTYSYKLKEDLNNNPYLEKQTRYGKEIFAVKQEAENVVTNAINDKANAAFIKAINTVLDIYILPIINKETQKIELFNTTLKLISDLQTINFNKIYDGFKNWKIKNDTKHKTKADRFKPATAKAMLEFIIAEKLHLKILKK